MSQELDDPLASKRNSSDLQPGARRDPNPAPVSVGGSPTQQSASSGSAQTGGQSDIPQSVGPLQNPGSHSSSSRSSSSSTSSSNGESQAPVGISPKSQPTRNRSNEMEKESEKVVDGTNGVEEEEQHDDEGSKDLVSKGQEADVLASGAASSLARQEASAVYNFVLALSQRAPQFEGVINNFLYRQSGQ